MPVSRGKSKVLAYRVPGDTNVFGESTNFNFGLRRQKEQKLRYRLVYGMIFFTFVPIFFMFYNAQENFKKTGMKEMVQRRRERMDKQFGIDREQIDQDYDRLDEIYGVSEKEEIERYRRAGKSTREYYEMKQMREELQKQKELEEAGLVMKQAAPGSEQLRNKLKKRPLVNKEELEISEIKGDGYEQLMISQNADSPDPRVGGTKIIFDSRLDKSLQNSETSEIEAFLKLKKSGKL
mmetsp:Transcript_11349/g.19123  ORF Transcript_11349/g.19123 Transcript_11349/m.19123 type:complete len:236 (-) Transcript_11349:48-755(-)